MTSRRPFVEHSRRSDHREHGEIREILRESEETVRRFLDELDAAKPSPSRRRPTRRELPREEARTHGETTA